MCRLQRSNDAKSGQSLDGLGRDHFEMFNSVSSIRLGPICLNRMFKGIKSVIDRSITDGMNGDLEVEGVGKIDNGEELGRGPNWSGGRAICIRLGEECSASDRQPCSLDSCSRPTHVSTIPSPRTLIPTTLSHGSIAFNRCLCPSAALTLFNLSFSVPSGETSQ